ncbi:MULTISPECIES: YjjG family noncanonical pyrimidine nucleotidase [Myroides]|uniref:YjjG family noncanonical pyrimidine nucleotidase n=1 Tax=Myroides TaxID=76831 RepID=UPI001303E2DF|nr:YjjG family noncanonical pyrimidine nucleotidase [Myroides phaeus]
MSFGGFSGKTNIFFDLDHTLWDFETNSAKAFEQVIAESNFPFTSEQFLNYYIDINAVYWDKYSLNQVTKEELRVGRIRDTFEALDYESSVEGILKLGDEYIRTLPNFNHLFDGAVELLDYLQQKYRLHIITNGFSEVQQKKLSNSGIEDYFITVTNSELAGVNKPDPQIFHFAMNQAKAKVDEAVMVGDNLLADIKGALGVGMDAIYYNQFDKEVSPEIIQVNELIKIKDLL